MEKFGIFELLDALAALTAKEDAEKPAEETPSADDAAFAPPQYAADPAASEETAAQPQADTAPPQRDALSNFYARHNAVARKAQK